MFWQNFTAFCSRIGKTPNAVASELGLSNSITTSWKNGSMPRSDTLQRIAKYFSVSISELLGDAKSPAPKEGEADTDRDELIRILSVLDPVEREQLLAHGRTLVIAHEAQDNDPKSQ